MNLYTAHQQTKIHQCTAAVSDKQKRVTESVKRSEVDWTCFHSVPCINSNIAKIAFLH